MLHHQARSYLRLLSGGIALSTAAWISLGGCQSESSDLDRVQNNGVETHVEADGTTFQTAVGSAAALPADFPTVLIYPESSLVSSGQIYDQAGGVASILLQTQDDPATIQTYYQEKLWYRNWNLLSEFEDEGVITTTYSQGNSPDRNPTSQLNQLVIQIGTPRGDDQTRDLLILLSQITTPEAFASPSPQFFNPNLTLNPDRQPIQNPAQMESLLSEPDPTQSGSPQKL